MTMMMMDNCRAVSSFRVVEKCDLGNAIIVAKKEYADECKRCGGPLVILIRSRTPKWTSALTGLENRSEEYPNTDYESDRTKSTM